MSLIVGLAGASRNGAVAACDAGRVVAMCEHERVTRTRREALTPGKIPAQTLATILRLGDYEENDVRAFVAAEPALATSDGIPVSLVDHHLAHAATAFYTSPFEEATVVVCDRSGTPELTVWHADRQGIRRTDFSWQGPGLAMLYSLAAEAMRFGPDAEARLEALAQIGGRAGRARIPDVVWRDDALVVPENFQAAISDASGAGLSAPTVKRANLASQVQRQLGDALLDVMTSIAKQVGGSNLCLAGGLFYNSYFNTLVARSNLFANTFVPANPGNAGGAIGAALLSSSASVQRQPGSSMSPFLGPGFTPEEVKATLDNCKLSYDYISSGRLIEQATTALAKGKLIGWFQGRMEWGVRALGNRSILASPIAPYVLENLNRFLKQREAHRTYSVAVCVEAAPKFFCGPAQSTLMEYEYEVLDRDRFRHLLPENASRVRVQTVDASAGIFYDLLRAFGDLTGVPMLVNTSFNGFNEPIVCHPRDAVRVFYGTGLDMAVLGNLVIQK